MPYYLKPLECVYMDNKNKPLTLLEISDAATKRVTLISREFSNGFEFIKNYPRSVTFFGSARTKEDEPYYQKALLTIDSFNIDIKKLADDILAFKH